MRLGTFLAIDIATAAVTRAIFVYLGYRIGEPAVRVVEIIGRYSWYLSIVLLVGIFFNLWRQSRARRARSAAASAEDPG
jgi:membrane protein DedA with SNARE-associated domain